MKKEYFNIPNLLGYFRILMIPVFLFLYYRADTNGEYIAAFLVLAVIYLTDFFDGKIARKFNMVTDWGKMLDPVADKLLQAALAVAVTFKYPLIVWFLVLFIVKEIYMAVMGLYLIKKENAVNGAQWYGKVCTAFVDIGIFVLLLCLDLSYMAANIFILLMMLVMCLTLIRYILFHISIIKGKDKKWGGRYIVMGCVLLLLYIIIGAIVPYIKQPQVSESYKESFNVQDFYSGDISCDRAMIIEDNGEALAERIRMTEYAKKSIIISTFDFRSDTSGKQLIAALKAAAQRGISVQILMDGFNSWTHMEGNPYFYALAAEENVTIKIYNMINPLMSWKGMSRMHDKYMIVDDSVYLLGGRNLFDCFLGNQDSFKNHDRDVLVYNTGGAESSLYQVKNYFMDIWELDYCRVWKDSSLNSMIPSVKKADRELDELYAHMRQENSEWFDITNAWTDTKPVNKITLISNPTSLYSKEPYVFYGLSELMKNADKQVIIHTPYIICNNMMYKSFSEICSKAPSVTMMTNSSANNGNPFGAVDYALNKEKILNTGLNVLEYEGGISYHGKSIVIDDDIAIVGSFNMDMKSVYQDTELMLVVQSEEVNAQLRENLLSYQQYAKEAELNSDEFSQLVGKNVSIKERLQRYMIKLLDPLLRFLL